MQTRRMVMASLAGAAAAVGISAGARADDDIPTARTIAGHPPYMDFGDGVKVPLNRGAFLTLWEGPSYWLTFGFGSAAVTERAKGLAVHRAIGAMRYLLLTLAFAPERLQKVDGNGWHQKVEDPTNYVFGEIEIPGQPGAAVSDAAMGFGNADANLYVGGNSGAGIGPSGSPVDPTGAFTGLNRSAMLTGVNAFCSYVVKKRDLSLDDVRSRARMVHL
jgi:hypothetical protein